MATAVSGQMSALPVRFELKEFKQFPDRMALVTQVFLRFYEDQLQIVERIKNGQNLSCRLLYRNEEPVGFFVYGNQLTNEYGSERSFHIEQVALINPERDAGKGFRTELFDQAVKLAQSVNATAVHMILKPGCYRFLETRGFKMVQELPDLDAHVVQKVLPPPTSEVKESEPDVIPAPPVAIHISPEDMEFIKSEKKTVHGVFNTKKYADIKEGDRLRFQNHFGEVFCLVKDVIRYESFRYMLKEQGAIACPQFNDLDEATNYYSQLERIGEQQRGPGVIALEIEVIPAPFVHARQRRAREA